MRLTARQEDRLLRTVLQTGPGYRVATTVLLLVVAWAVFAWVYQLRYGLGVTGMHDRVPWGFYIVGFVFFSGLSMAGTLISAILRLTGADQTASVHRRRLQHRTRYEDDAQFQDREDHQKERNGDHGELNGRDPFAFAPASHAPHQ